MALSDPGRAQSTRVHGPSTRPRPLGPATSAVNRSPRRQAGPSAGDHPETARAIAPEIGLLTGDDPRDELVVVGKQLPADDSVLGPLLDRDGAVVARVSSEDNALHKAVRARAQRRGWGL